MSERKFYMLNEINYAYALSEQEALKLFADFDGHESVESFIKDCSPVVEEIDSDCMITFSQYGESYISDYLFNKEESHIIDTDPINPNDY